MARPKRSKSEVSYQEHPHGKERCDNCEPFVTPDGCKTVEGKINPGGWCKIYTEA
jgi:hypothetical protein